MSLIDQTACQLLDLLESGSVTAREVSTEFCERIRAVEPKIQSLLYHQPSVVEEQAAVIDRRRASGEPVGRLAGLPIVLKDNLCTCDAPTTCASRILADFTPPYDAHVVHKLRTADAVLLGKSNLDEFAMGSSTENSAIKVTRNPWDLERVPGGSSGGSAAAVAARMTPWALGSDTGGSIRQPAGMSGVVGLKPTYGRVSRYGLVAFASSLDQIGPLARTVRDVALLLEVIAGHDSRDSTSVDQTVPQYSLAIFNPIVGLKVGVVPEHFGEGLDEAVRRAVNDAIGVLRTMGATIREVALPHAKFAIPTYYLVATAEASSNLARYDGVHYGFRANQFEDMIDMYASTRGIAFGAEVKRRIMLGTFALSAGYRDAYYTKALRVRRLIKEDFDRAFESVDVIVGPVAPTAAFKLGEKLDDPLAMYLSDIYTVSANLAGVPGLCLPCGFTGSGLPIGLQIQGPPFGEEIVLRVGHLYQSQTDWHCRRPHLQ
jgi:aspartyl-tRNA(Asn)/glutamyl-tRNA(Gln) amidotransferase subunit A